MSDPLAVLPGGEKPKRLLADNESVEVSSSSSGLQIEIYDKTNQLPLLLFMWVFALKYGALRHNTDTRTYAPTGPAWRNQSRVKAEVRTCKHLKELLGEAYELARTTLTKDSAKPANPAQNTRNRTSRPSSKTSNTHSKSSRHPRAEKRKAPDEEVDQEADEGAEDEGSSKTTSDTPKDSATPQSGAATPSGDELAEISGVKPKTYLADGDSHDVKSLTRYDLNLLSPIDIDSETYLLFPAFSSSTYKIKRTWDHYYCTCPAWRNQGGAPTNARSCKHLKALLGEEYEAARLKLKNPYGADSSSSSKDTRPAKRAKKDNGSSNSNGNAGVKSVPELLLAVKWDLATGRDPTGWWMSEKLDGVRVFYDGEKMWSRLGNPFTPPKEFLDRLPKKVTLDGEVRKYAPYGQARSTDLVQLFGGRGKFQDTVSIVKTINSPHWKNITFQIFDIPSRGSEPFEERVAWLKKNLKDIPQVNVVEQTMCQSRDHLLETLKDVERQGGEGMMLRQPGSEYEGKRSSSLLKVKTFYDGEAEVVGYEPGKGKHKGVTGALKCVMASGKASGGPKFSVGSGLSDKQRRTPPKIGSIVTYRFQELTRDGVPRFPTFVGIAIDKDKPSDPQIPNHGINNRTD
ncbi:ATP-dependent DNA ligase [Ceratobasidium theobromae]|uniref:ATP-dependent DNA ligase n=1 Tax=Ceratobasidium theobromae TaxID=1582974 RepID=A0A5N5QHD5_9AGAM|nr:ATP-dependent DNA ligase [Ceratobasidium theobromae]